MYRSQECCEEQQDSVELYLKLEACPLDAILEGLAGICDKHFKDLLQLLSRCSI